MLKRKLIIGTLILSLAACTSGGSKDDDVDSTDGIAADALANDNPVKDDDGFIKDESAEPAAPGAIKKDLAQDTMGDDLESELNSVAGDAKSPAAPQNEASNDEMSLEGDAAAPPVADAAPAPGEPPAATDAAPTDMPIVAEAAHEDPVAPSAQAAAEPPAATDAAPQADLPVENAPAAGAAQASAGSESVEIRNIRYVSNKNGGTVVIDSSAPVTYRTRAVPGQNQFVIEISGAKLPARLKRPFLTKDFRQSIASIDAYQESGSTTARVVVQFREPANANVRQEGNSLTVAAAGAGQIDDDATSTTTADAGAPGGASTPGAAEPFAGTGTADSGEPTHFYGKPISIEVRNTDIRDVINLIAEQSGANIVVSDTVKGDVTLKLKQVPWDQALLIIMKSKGLGYARQGNVLRIAPDEQLQKEADDMKKIQDAKNLAMPLRVRVVPVGYAKVEDLVPEVTGFLSVRGKIAPDKRTAALVITDIPENLDRVTNLIRALDTPPLQVLIEGKIVEASEQFAKSFGINWGLSGGTFASGSATLNPSLNVSPGTVASTGGVGAALNWGTLGNLGNLTAQIGLTETQGITKVLSSPRVVTLNNETAVIKQIKQIPILTTTTSASTTPTTSYSYKPVELSLNVTPQITSTSDVILSVTVKREFTDAAPSSAAPPDVESREANTKVMVRSGRTAVIGGIYQNDELNEKDGVPVLKDMPVVGWLFKNETKNRVKNELLIFLTPKILKDQQTRMASEKAPGPAAPTDSPDIGLDE